MNTVNKTIDLMPYLPVQPERKASKTLHGVIETVGFIVESAVTIGIGVCLLAGVYIFLSIV